MATEFPQREPMELPPLPELMAEAIVTEDDAQELLETWKAEPPEPDAKTILEAVEVDTEDENGSQSIA